MNKIILSLLLTTALTSAANAQNCVNSSRCDELGYTKTAADCTGLDILTCPFDKNKAFCSSNTAKTECRVADILFSDMSCSPVLVTGKTPIAVVFSDFDRLAVALESKRLPWGGNGKEIGATAQTASGKLNTKAILAYGKANGIKYSAAEYCNNYSTEGTKVGDWYWPSKEEWIVLAESFVIVNRKLKGLASIGKAKYMNSADYWTSTEYDSDKAWHINSHEQQGKSSKSESWEIRPVLAF